MSVDSIERVLKRNDLTFREVDDRKMNKVDNARASQSFAEFLIKESSGSIESGLTPISQQEFVDRYFERFENSLPYSEYEDEWKRRLEVTYPSLIRDIHFYYYVDEHAEFDTISYDWENDFKSGVDLFIEHDGDHYYVNLYVDTSKSRNYLDSKKNGRHPEFGSAEEIHLPITGSNARTIRAANGEDVWLYGEDRFLDLTTKII